MPVETLRPSGGRLPVGPAPFASAMPFRILNKGPGYFRRQAEPGARRPSAVERLEADKAKYVKSQQVALTRQAPVIRKPLLSPAAMLQCRIAAPPARKTPPRPALSGSENDGGGGGGGGGGRRGPHLNLEILNNLINDVCERPSSPASGSAPSGSSPSGSSPSASGAKSVGSSLSAEPEGSARRLLLHLRPGDHHHAAAAASSSTSSCASSSSPLNSARCHAPPDLPAGRPPPVPARGLRAGPPAAAPGGAPSSVTVRRVDVRPQAEEVRKPQRRPQLPPKPPPKPQPPAPAPAPPRQTAQPQAPPPPLPPAPARLPYPPPSPMRLRAALLKPPASPAFTRLSSASSRGSRAGGSGARKQRPSLHRSKSDLSDRYSRATADLERFFNYCGLDAPEVDALGGVERFARGGGAASDIVSVSRLRSVSTPSSECGGERGEEEADGLPVAPGAGERVPYGISVIERNARVIKWLYGLRQAKDGAGVSNV